MTLTLISTAFAPAGEIPKRHTCQGTDCSPPQAWQGVPATARSLVLMS